MAYYFKSKARYRFSYGKKVDIMGRATQLSVCTSMMSALTWSIRDLKLHPRGRSKPYRGWSCNTAQWLKKECKDILRWSVAWQNDNMFTKPLFKQTWVEIVDTPASRRLTCSLEFDAHNSTDLQCPNRIEGGWQSAGRIYLTLRDHFYRSPGPIDIPLRGWRLRYMRPLMQRCYILQKSTLLNIS